VGEAAVLKPALGLGLAITAHAALAVLVLFLFPFLQGMASPPAADDGPSWWLLDGLLAVQFGVLHSLLLLPAMRKRLERFIPSPLYGCVFCLTTCLSLLLVMACWQRSAVVVWRLNGWTAWPVEAVYLLSWCGLAYTLSLTGYGWQTGWTPFWSWFRGRQTPRRKFEERGPYRVLRHPVYLCFLGLIWCTPTATLDRALLIGVWTAYVAVGSWLKDRRLEFYLGEVYRRYRARVPGYPGSDLLAGNWRPCSAYSSTTASKASRTLAWASSRVSPSVSSSGNTGEVTV
jgi:protein-S-isoprenylcysteine O-methyltransferase Ste14